MYDSQKTFGEQNPLNGQAPLQPFGYTGYQYDEIAGTYYAQAREYRPKEGRFSAEDVIRGSITVPFTLNRYGYCWGNPLALIDLNGEEPITAADGIEAHKLLQGELSSLVPNVKTEQPIPGAGIADILYYIDGTVEVYEIKPGSYAPGAINYLEGKLQLDRYIMGLQKNNQVSVPGTTLNPIINATLLPSVIHTDKMIKYYTYKSDPGMIYWQYVNKPKREPDEVILFDIIPQEAAEKAGEMATGLAIIWVAYEIIKWVAAVVAAPATGGTSLVGAACTP